MWALAACAGAWLVLELSRRGSSTSPVSPPVPGSLHPADATSSDGLTSVSESAGTRQALAAGNLVEVEAAAFEPPAASPDEAVVRLEVRIVQAPGSEPAPVTLKAWMESFGGSEEQRVELPEARLHVFGFGSTGDVLVIGVQAGAIGKARLATPDPGSYRLDLLMERGTTIGGVVTDQLTGRPVEGAQVSTYDRTNVSLAPVLTDAQGEFEIGPWPLDVLMGLEIWARGYGPELARVRVAGDGSWQVPARFGQPESMGRGRAFVDVRLVPEKVVTGRVLISGAAGDMPLGQVEAHGDFLVIANISMADVATAPVAPDGRFLLEGLRSDIRHGIVVRVPGRSLRVLEAPPVAGVVDLGELTLDAPNRVSGTVLGASAEPIPGAKAVLTLRPAREGELQLSPDGGANAERDAWGPTLELARWESFTDSQGRFAFEGTGSGQFHLYVKVLGRMVAERSVEVRVPDLQVDPLVLEQDLRHVEVRVQLDGAPLAGATVQLANYGFAEQLAEYRTDARGVFHSFSLEPERTYVARITPLQGEPVDQRFTLEEGQESLALSLDVPPAADK